MSNEKVLNIIMGLSQVQGFYVRLYSILCSLSEESKKEYLDSFKDCKDTLDVILKIEG